MQTTQIRWTPDSKWSNSADDFRDADLVLAFADTAYFQTPACYQALKDKGLKQISTKYQPTPSIISVVVQGFRS